jgi:hypothetical protein
VKAKYWPCLGVKVFEKEPRRLETPLPAETARGGDVKIDVHDVLRCTPALRPFHTHGKVV